MSMNNLAISYAALGRHAEALKLREETLALRKAKLGPDHPDTLISMNDLADSYAALGRQPEALSFARRRWRCGRRSWAPPPRHVEHVQRRESLVVLDRPSESLAIIDDCLERAKGRALDPRFVPLALELRLRVFARQKDVSGCRQTAELSEKLGRHDGPGLYCAARCRAVTAGLLRAAGRTPDAGQQADAEADIAMSWLAKAVAAGYPSRQNLVRMTRDVDLDALRNRADFRSLMAELFDRGFPKDPFAVRESVTRSLSNQDGAKRCR